MGYIPYNKINDDDENSKIEKERNESNLNNAKEYLSSLENHLFKCKCNIECNNGIIEKETIIGVEYDEYSSKIGNDKFIKLSLCIKYPSAHGVEYDSYYASNVMDYLTLYNIKFDDYKSIIEEKFEKDESLSVYYTNMNNTFEKYSNFLDMLDTAECIMYLFYIIIICILGILTCINVKYRLIFFGVSLSGVLIIPAINFGIKAISKHNFKKVLSISDHIDRLIDS